MTRVVSTDIDNLIRQYMGQAFEDGTTRQTYLRKLIKTTGPSKAGGSQWKFTDAGISGAAVGEGDPLPAAERFTQLDPQLNAAYFAATIEVTDETLDKIETGELVLADYVMAQVMDASVGLDDQIEAATVAGTNATNGFVGLGAWGLDTGSPAGLSRTTYANWQALTLDNSAVNRPLSMSLMRQAADTLLGTNQGRFNAVLMSPTNATVYQGLSGVGQAMNVYNVDSGAQRAVGYGSALDVLAPIGLFDGVPVYRIPTMGSSVVWFADLDKIHYEQVRQIRVSEPRRTEARTTVWDISVGINLVVPNPMKNIAAITDIG